jgi:hypothetical protein
VTVGHMFQELTHAHVHAHTCTHTSHTCTPALFYFNKCKKSKTWDRNSLMFLPCIIRHSINNQHYALICTTPLFYLLAPTCFGSSLPSSGSFLDLSELLEIQIEWVVYHIMCGCVACVSDCRGSERNHDNPTPIRFVFQVSQKDLRCSLMMAGYCRNM